MTQTEPIPGVMTAVVLVGHGGYDKLVVRYDVPVPSVGVDEVLVRVHTCGLNNTDINTRTGWYGDDVRDGTKGDGADTDVGGGWGGAVEFPRIQGADVCGTAVAVGGEVGRDGLLGRRVLIDPWILDHDVADVAMFDSARYFGSEVDGGFAQYCVAPARNVHAVESDLSDAELATFACASSTAANLLAQASVGAGDVVVVTGASGGVGTAAIQIAKASGAHVVGVASASKADLLLALGADAVVDRSLPDLAEAVLSASPSRRIDAIADVVGGSMFEQLIPALRRGGRYSTAGAIAGPIVEFDLRNLIYSDLKMAGATVCPPGTFAEVVRLIEAGSLKPVLAATYPLDQLADAQRSFVGKSHIGNIVVEIPH